MFTISTILNYSHVNNIYNTNVFSNFIGLPRYLSQNFKNLDLIAGLLVCNVQAPVCSPLYHISCSTLFQIIINFSRSLAGLLKFQGSSEPWLTLYHAREEKKFINLFLSLKTYCQPSLGILIDKVESYKINF